ncbi:hypothetical protein PSH03_005382 [Micromonospora sp. PSH03]|uniref:hypothetical protein n=1 Tax=Micromonospora salmantinae TaxID=2911211 RepID=UPI001EE87E22|nr:hypothetical protein [Micromonospora salmantinae]MCG5459600.1 hypothetical protein [Micromonospora salmantinae]
MTDDTTRDDIVVSFKPHTGYDAPLVAVKGKDAATVMDKLGEIEATGLFAKLANMDTAFKAAFNIGATLGGTPTEHPQTAQSNYRQQPQQQRRQPATPPPGLTAPTCPHGTKNYVEGQYGPFWGCPADRNDPGKCRPEKIPK